MPRRFIARQSSPVILALVAVVAAACADVVPTGGTGPARARAVVDLPAAGSPGEPNAAAGDVKAVIGAWLDGERVELTYTRSYHCEEPPSSIAPSGCELGAPPQDFPRGGPIPTIYALAPAGFMPADPATVHCMGCANHPSMIDITRLGLPVPVATRPPHSHIVTSRQAGWHNTVNIRVTSPWAWEQIVASPSLATVRQLQAEHPALVGRDIPTNIFFFFQVRSPAPAP